MEEKEYKYATAQEAMIEELLETGEENEMMQILDFVKKNGVPLTQDQVIGTLLLNEMGLGDLAGFVQVNRTIMTPVSRYFKMTDKLTLADRIKGNAKLGNLLKANANPANAASQKGAQ
ncbi:hypothetical protein UY416_25525 [Paenibacillus polymyxa]|uniref:hypothetical protein n=1 Tax=Paenibacillus polymyxa TaxID=1406 RepID=UPI002AB3F756|nr:hypothetical protein [Paenibacillus polymyxa]MDY8049654.1 hypothetical protein [Paenibacillus polymyxa]